MNNNLENKIWVFIQNRRLQKTLSNIYLNMNLNQIQGLSLTKYNSLKYFTKRKKQNKEKYNLNIPIIYSCKIIDLIRNKGIHHTLLNLIENIDNSLIIKKIIQEQKDL